MSESVKSVDTTDIDEEINDQGGDPDNIRMIGDIPVYRPSYIRIDGTSVYHNVDMW